MKKILIDARLYGIEHTGVGRYVKGLLINLGQDHGIELAAIVHPTHLNDYELKRFRLIPAKHHPYAYRAQIELLRILYQEKPDLLHIPHFTISPLWLGKTVITIHDLIKHESRGTATTTKNRLLYWPKYIQYLTLVRLAIKRAKHVIVPSKFWKDKLIAKYNLPEDKVTVTYEGIDPVFFTKGKKIKEKLKSPYILYVGNVYPHKNLETIIKATVKLNGKVHLYISCARNVFWERTAKLIDKLNAREVVTHLGFVPDEELVTLYKSALSFVTASKIEGLGLPGLEAMASGTAVISSSSSCLPEVYGNGALFFDADKPQELAQNIDTLLNDPNQRSELIKKGKLQSSKYSWQKMANQTWKIYQKVLRE